MNQCVGHIVSLIWYTEIATSPTANKTQNGNHIVFTGSQASKHTQKEFANKIRLASKHRQQNAKENYKQAQAMKRPREQC